MPGSQYIEPWYIELQNTAEAQSPAAIAAKAAADQVYQLKLQQEAAFKASQQKSPSNWFNTDTSPFGRGPGRGGSRRRSRKSRKSRKIKKN